MFHLCNIYKTKDGEYRWLQIIYTYLTLSLNILLKNEEDSAGFNNTFSTNDLYIRRDHFLIFLFLLQVKVKIPVMKSLR